MTVLAENLQTMTGVNWRREVRFYVPLVEGGYAAAGAIATATVTVVPDSNGLIVTPELPSGRGQVRIDGHAYDFEIPTTATGNDVQMVIMADTPTTLTYDGQTTTSITVDATAAAVQAALEALPNVGVDHVAVLGDAGGPFTVLFKLPTGLAVPFELPASFKGLGGDVALMTASTAQVGTKLAVLLGLAIEYPPPAVLEAQEYAMAAAASATAAEQAATGISLAKVIHVDAQAGADDNARFDAAITALGTAPGVIMLGAKRYTLTTTKTINHGYQGITGPGQKCSFLSYTGTGACLRMYDSTAATGDEPDPAGPLRGFTIEGWANANTNTYGLLYGNLMNPDVDIHIEGFQNAGGVGFFGQNSNGNWCEGGSFRMRTRFCKTHYIFDTASWAYNDFDLWVRAEPNEDVINVGPIALAGLNGVRLYVHGNFISGAGSNTGTAIIVGPGSHIHGDIQVSVESNGSFVGHTDINIGAGGEIRGLGSSILDFQSYTAAWQKGTAKPTQILGIAFANCPSILTPGPEVKTSPIFFDSFTAADGTALDAAKWTVTTGGAAAAAVTTNGNRARFTTGATGGYSNADKAFAVSTVPTSLADVELLVRHTFGAVANESNMRYGVRATNPDPNTGSNYHVIVTNDSFYVDKRVSGTPTNLFAMNFSGLGLSAASNGGMKWIRLRVKGATIAAKIWDEGTPEPLGWTYTTTDSSVTVGGSVAVAIHGGSAAVSGVNYVDQFHIYAL